MMNYDNQTEIDLHFKDIKSKKLLKCIDYLISRYSIDKLLTTLNNKTDKHIALKKLCKKVKDVTEL